METGVIVRNAKLTEFDKESRQGHYYLSPEDDCFFFVEYTRGKSFSYSDGNSFINNLKKSPKTRGTAQWKHKQNAIDVAAKTLRRELPKKWLSHATFVPIPPSKARNHPEYDDRMLQILAKLNVDVRELVHQRRSMKPTHESENRHTVDELVKNYEIDEALSRPIPKHIVIVDDMITAGAHFKAMAKALGDRFLGVQISGVFLSRRVFSDDDEE